jgi:multisubunit Na+/H+ antiporter MnhB subunit
LFIPIALGTSKLYDWAHPDLVHKEYALAHRQPYMSPGWFIVRAVVYFAIWGILIYFLNRWSTEQDEKGGLEKRLARLSAPGLVLYVFTLTFAAVDWAASLDTDWSSTIWGFIFVAQQALSVFAFAIIVMALLSRREPMASAFRTQHLHDLGNLMLTCLMLWAYFEFSQLVIVWAGNLTDEIPWYLRRLATTWGWLGVALIVIQFIIPFLALLSRPLKRNIVALCSVVAVIIVMRWVDLAWIVLPGYYQRGFRVTWLMICVPLAMGCLWIAAFVWHLNNRPLLPINAPNLEKALHHGE